jgi:hypothetical protein
MKNLEKELEKLIENYGIDAVMRGLKNDHADKVFIPNWYYEEHIAEMGFQFDDDHDMWAFDEFMQDRNIANEINYTIETDYPSLWEEFLEEENELNQK